MWVTILLKRKVKPINRVRKVTVSAFIPMIKGDKMIVFTILLSKIQQRLERKGIKDIYDLIGFESDSEYILENLKIVFEPMNLQYIHIKGKSIKVSGI